MSIGGRLGRLGLRLGGNVPAWTLTGVLASLSFLLWWTHLRDLGPASSDLHIHWFYIALGFAIAESFVVHLHFRSEAGTFSLLELPLIAAILFADPATSWVVIIIGSALPLVFLRRQPLVKLCFNLTNLSLHFGIAVALTDIFLGGRNPLSPAGWLAIGAACILSEFVEAVSIAGVISLSEGRVRPADFINMVIFGSLISASTSVQALIAAIVVTQYMFGLVLLALSTALLFIAYRAYMSERDNRERVEFLYNSTQALRESDKTDRAVETLLQEATSMFRAGIAELHLFASPDSGNAYTLYRMTAAGLESEIRTDDEQRAHLELASHAVKPQLVIGDKAPSVLRDHADKMGFRDCLFGTLHTDDHYVGLLVLADRLGNVSDFSEQDLRLFDSLVQQTSVSFENEQLEQALVQLRELEAELAHQARYDSLTDLANRKLFSERLDQALASPSAEHVTVLYIDLDNFKPVNDTLGHSAGDELLIQVGHRIRGVIRDGDLPARLGGDEFAVVLTEVADVAHIGKRIIESLSSPFLLETHEVTIGASVGVAYARDAVDATQVLVNADLAMYRAKEIGKGSLVFYTDDLKLHVARNEKIQISLRRAVTEEEFEIRYQPIFRLADRGIIGAEALVRWRDSDGKLHSPAAFLTEAEQSGLVASIDHQVRAMVLGDLREFDRVAPVDFFASVNVSGKHIGESGFANALRRDLTVAGVAPERLVLELTESVMSEFPSDSSSTLVEISRLGAGIAVDDFGSGLTSLPQLRDLPLRMVKFSRTMVLDTNDTRGRALMEGAANLASRLGCAVVGKGIEDEDTVTMLMDLGCEYGQGYFLGQPMSAGELTTILNRQPEGITAS